MVALERLELSTAGLGNLKSLDCTAMHIDAVCPEVIHTKAIAPRHPLHIVAQHCTKVRYKPTPQPTPRGYFIEHYVNKSRGTLEAGLSHILKSTDRRA